MTEPTPTKTIDFRIDDSKTEAEILALANAENKIMIASNTRVLYLIDSTATKRKIGVLDTNGNLVATNLKIANLDTTSDPTVTDDSTSGYDIGSIWWNKTTSDEKYWVCSDASVGAAVWIQINAGGGGPVTADQVALADIDGSDYTHLQHYINIVQGSGWIDGCVVSVNVGDPTTIDVTAGNFMSKTLNQDIAPTGFVKSSAKFALALTDNAANFIYYNYLTDDIEASIDPAILSDESKAVCNYVWRSGSTIDIVDFTQGFANLNSIVNNKDIEEATGQGFGFAKRVTGMEIGTTGVRNLTLNAGKFYAGLVSKETQAFDTSAADTWTYYYSDGGGGWTSVTSVSQIDNQQYDDGTGTLATLSNGKFGVHWVYLDYSGEMLSLVYGTGDYTQAEAAAAAAPSSVPPFVAQFHTIVGKVTVEKGSNTLLAESPFITAFSAAAVPAHNSTSGLNTGEYFHLTNEEYTNFIGTPITREPTGFTDPENVTINYDSLLRTVTLTGTVNAYWRGINVGISSGWVSDPHPAAPTQNQFLFYNGTSFTWSTSVWQFYELPVVAVIVDGTGAETNFLNFAIREVHGLMQWESHRELHQNIGTYRQSGGDVTVTLDSTTAGDRRPTISEALIFDEDLPTTNLEHTTQNNYTQYRLNGASADVILTDGQTDIVNLSGSRPYYNQFTGGVWQETLISNNNFMNVWLMAIPSTSDAQGQNYRFVWIQGQAQYATLSGALDEQFTDVNFGQFGQILPEFVVIQRLVVEYSGGDWNVAASEKILGNRVTATSSPSGNFLTFVTTDGDSVTGDGTVGNALAAPGTKLATYPLDSLSSTETKIGSQEIRDSNMDESGTLEWLSNGTNTLSKEDNGEGGQCLRITYVSTANPTITQTNDLILNNTYYTQIRTRASSSNAFSVFPGTSAAAISGTATTSWQYFDVSEVADVGGNIVIIASGLTGYLEVEFLSSRLQRVTSSGNKKIRTISQENDFVYPNDFSQANWSKSALNVGSLEYDNLFPLVATATTGVHYIAQTISMVAGSRVVSFRCRPGSQQWIAILDTVSNAVGFFDLQNAENGTLNAAVESGRVKDMKDGTYLVSMQFQSITSSSQLRLYLAEADNDTNFTGDGVTPQMFASFAHSYEGTLSDLVEFIDGGASAVLPSISHKWEQDFIELEGLGFLQRSDSTIDQPVWQLPVENDDIEYILDNDYRGTIYCKHYSKVIDSASLTIDTIASATEVYPERLIIFDGGIGVADSYPVPTADGTTSKYARLRVTTSGVITLDVGVDFNDSASIVRGRISYRK